MHNERSSEPCRKRPSRGGTRQVGLYQTDVCMTPLNESEKYWSFTRPKMPPSKLRNFSDDTETPRAIHIRLAEPNRRLSVHHPAPTVLHIACGPSHHPRHMSSHVCWDLPHLCQVCGDMRMVTCGPNTNRMEDGPTWCETTNGLQPQ